jgi:hypothetical protein
MELAEFSVLLGRPTCSARVVREAFGENLENICCREISSV